MSRLRTLPFVGVASASLAAIWIQGYTDALPLGLFNNGARQLALASHAALVLVAAGLAVFLWELLRGRPTAPGALLRRALAAFVLLELLLFALDAGWVSRGDGAPVGGPYRELRNARAEWLYLKKAHPGSSLGFRSVSPASRRSPGPRVLFLGDSYTEGSGSAAACNYPEVATAVLGERLGRRFESLNAGVAGYGPEDARRLLELLIERDYGFDAVVFSLFLENDFTDNLPGTERRVVVGMNQRFPRSAFLRSFHPLNSRSVRWALFLTRTAGAGRQAQTTRAAGECDLHPPAAELAPAELRGLAQRRLEANYARAGARGATAVVSEAVRAMAALAERRGARFALVVFPDRILVDAWLRAQLGGIDERRYALTRLQDFVAAELGPLQPIDVRPALLAGAPNYRSIDTHLGDLGNVRAGRYVGEQLAARWADMAGPLGLRR